jgi:hypothetical protein
LQPYLRASWVQQIRELVGQWKTEGVGSPFSHGIGDISKSASFPPWSTSYCRVVLLLWSQPPYSIVLRDLTFTRQHHLLTLVTYIILLWASSLTGNSILLLVLTNEFPCFLCLLGIPALQKLHN